MCWCDLQALVLAWFITYFYIIPHWLIKITQKLKFQLSPSNCNFYVMEYLFADDDKNVPIVVNTIFLRLFKPCSVFPGVYCGSCCSVTCFSCYVLYTLLFVLENFHFAKAFSVCYRLTSLNVHLGSFAITSSSVIISRVLCLQDILRSVN